MNIEKINKYYDDKHVVQDVDLVLPQGKVIGFIGPNGAGKSTVLNIATRLTRQDSGQVLLEEKAITDWKNKELAKKMAILTQKNNIAMKLTIRELVSFGRFPYCGSNLTKVDVDFVNQAIAYMELDDLADNFIDEVSGGQLQRAYIAMVIAQDSDYVFLDEPTNNLDIYHASNLMKMVKKLSDELGKTVILVLHDINFASMYCDYIAAFKDGELYQFGDVNEVMTKATLKALYQVDFDIQLVKGKPIAIYY